MQLLTLVALLCSAHGCLGSRLSKRQSSGNDSAIVESPVEIGQFPFVAFLHVKFSMDNIVDCSASIVHTKFLLTAAHCVYGHPHEVIVTVGASHVKGGVWALDSYLSLHQIIHPQYTYGQPLNDIAVVKTVGVIGYNRDTIGPVYLIISDKLETGTALIAVGYREPKPNSPNVKNLDAVEVKVFDRVQCRVIYGRNRTRIPNSSFCAAYNSQAACLSNPGGPVVNKLREQVGIVSGSVGCSDRGTPAVYTDIVPYRRWIRASTIVN